MIKAMKRFVGFLLTLGLLTACENTLVQELLRAPVYFSSLELRYGIAGVGSGGGMIDPFFNPRTTSYTAVIPFEADTITLRASGETATYALKHGGRRLNDSGVFELFPEEIDTVFTFTVTATRKYMSPTVYTITVRRGETAARLAGLSLFTTNFTAADPAAFEAVNYLNNFFPPGLAYGIKVPYYATKLKFEVAPLPGGMVDYKKLVDGVETENGALSGTEILLDFYPELSCQVKLTARGLGGGMDDGEYVINISRDSATAYLSRLKVHAGAAAAGDDWLGKVQSFVPSGGIYQATVPFDTAEISLDILAAVPGSTLAFSQSYDYDYNLSTATVTNAGTWAPVAAASPPVFPFVPDPDKRATALRITVSHSGMEDMIYTALIRREVPSASITGISVKDMAVPGVELFPAGFLPGTLAHHLQLAANVETVRVSATPESGGAVSYRREDGNGTWSSGVSGALEFAFIGRITVEIRVTTPLKADQVYLLTLMRIGVNDIVVPLDTHVPAGFSYPGGKVRANALVAGVPTPVSNALPGEVITLTVQANTGYKITGIAIAPVEITLGSNYTGDGMLENLKVHPDPASSAGDTYKVWKFKMPDRLVKFDITYEDIAAGKPGIAYVAAVSQADKPYRRPGGIGHSWADASTDLQDTINRYFTNGVDATGGTNYDAIWILKGTYTPESWAEGISGDGQTGSVISPNGSNYGIQTAGRDAEGKNKSFVLRPGLKIYGGFEGTEGPAHNPETPSHNAGKTILSGGGNSCHTVLAVNIPASPGTLLHSLTIANGQGSSSFTGSITTGGAVIYQRSGAGVYNHNASPSFTNVIIENNRAATYGGQMNSAYATDTAAYGAGIYNIATGGGVTAVCNPVLTNVTIRNNTVVGYGGGMANLAYTPGTGNKCEPVLNNVTIQNNSSSGGRGGGHIQLCQ
ncbi:MAG: cadherin-like beta sandwich domain-containing protein [Treponema sp.]|jgi:hypothetical protein|nr:cadherin-like beta sandwich domain-containing protein [Treponema sp.]